MVITTSWSWLTTMDSRASVLDHSWRLEHTHLVIRPGTAG